MRKLPSTFTASGPLSTGFGIGVDTETGACVGADHVHDSTLAATTADLKGDCGAAQSGIEDNTVHPTGVHVTAESLSGSGDMLLLHCHL